MHDAASSRLKERKRSLEPSLELLNGAAKEETPTQAGVALSRAVHPGDQLLEQASLRAKRSRAAGLECQAMPALDKVS